MVITLDEFDNTLKWLYKGYKPKPISYYLETNPIQVDSKSKTSRRSNRRNRHKKKFYASNYVST